MLRLPQTKTHCHGQDIVLVDQHAPVDPVSLLKSHLQVNALWCDDPIFSFSSPDTTSTLTKSIFLQCCNAIWSTLGYLHTTGHCFWIEGTMELLIAGILPDVVKATGHWSSKSFLHYWHSLDDLVPLHIHNLHIPILVDKGRGSHICRLLLGASQWHAMAGQSSFFLS